MKQFTKIFLLFILMITFSSCLFNKPNTNKIDNEAIKETIKENKTEESTRIPTLEEIVNKLCSDEFDGRLVGTKGNELAAYYISQTFSQIGLTPLIDNKFEYSYSHNKDSKTSILVDNVIGKINGKDSKKAIVVSAHFDHIGKENGVICRGAVDNASGIAILIHLANYLKKINADKLEYDVVFAAFNGEEKGGSGSMDFVNKIKDIYSDVININVDSVGYKNGGKISLLNSFNIINQTKADYKFKELYDKLKSSFSKNNMEISQKILLAGSDDFSFQYKGYNGIWITEENIKEVINSNKDIPQIVDYTKLEGVLKSLCTFFEEFQTISFTKFK